MALTLTEAQNAVQATAPNDYYATVYRPAEDTYLPRLCAWLEQLPAGRAVDIGPGWGTMLTWLTARGWRADCVDMMPAGHWIPGDMIGRLGVEFVRHDICSGPVPGLEPGSYDLLLCGQVLGHVKFSPAEALGNILPLLKPGGVAVVHVLDRNRQKIVSATQDWRDLPRWGEAAPTDLMNSTQYDAASFETLLWDVFGEVNLWPDEGGYVLFADCRA